MESKLILELWSNEFFSESFQFCTTNFGFIADFEICISKVSISWQPLTELKFQ